MNRTEFTFQADDGKVLAATKWVPGRLKPVKGTVQIVHGMAEHRKRYDEFAAFLANQGFAVYADDHRGHGETISAPEERGFFAAADGWQRVADDLFQFSGLISEEYPDEPCFLLGHSMGSLLARTLMIQHPERYNGIILSGTACGQGLLGSIGKMISRREIRRKGPMAPNIMLDRMSFGAYNKAFAPTRTEADWLSRDTDMVDKAIADPLCGFVCTSSFFLDLITGVELVNNPGNLSGIPKCLPLYLFSGSEDPVGMKGKGVKKVYADFQKAGIRDLTMKLYEGARHETLNEINRQEVYEDVLNWLNSKLSVDCSTPS